jgi:polyhydroxybutyrate depolymerase
MRERTLLVNGRERRFRIAYRDGARAPLPAIVEFHGSGHVAADQVATSDFLAIAAREDLAVVAPEATIPVRLRPEWPAGRAWNVPGVPLTNGEFAQDAPDDVAFTRAIVRTLVSEGVADASRIYLTGFSGGARLCSYLAGVMPESIAAIATVAGLRIPPRATTEPPPILAFHSRSDAINPYLGGAGLRWDLGVEETAAAFAERYAWSGPSIDISQGLIRHGYRDRRGRERLITYTLQDAPHSWPGSRDPRHVAQYGAGTDAVDASALIWAFFRDQRR